jgi:hypothetical protein
MVCSVRSLINRKQKAIYYDNLVPHFHGRQLTKTFLAGGARKTLVSLETAE